MRAYGGGRNGKFPKPQPCRVLPNEVRSSCGLPGTVPPLTWTTSRAANKAHGDSRDHQDRSDIGECEIMMAPS